MAPVILTQFLMGYIDPGSGGLLLQIILGGAAGFGVAFKMFWGHFVRSSQNAPKVEQRRSSPGTR